jgi:hypothetical protein
MFNLENNKIYFIHEIKITKNLKEKVQPKIRKMAIVNQTH